MTIEPVSIHDAAAIHHIAQQNGLPASWSWNPKSHGAVAKQNGVVVAFTCVYETAYGMCVDELWPENSKYGLHGMKLLGDWVEAQAQRLANERNEPLDCGGLVHLSNPNHKAMLEKHGYTKYADVLSKRFLPQVLEQAS